MGWKRNRSSSSNETQFQEDQAKRALTNFAIKSTRAQQLIRELVPPTSRDTEDEIIDNFVTAFNLVTQSDNLSQIRSQIQQLAENDTSFKLIVNINKSIIIHNTTFEDSSQHIPLLSYENNPQYASLVMQESELISTVGQLELRLRGAQDTAQPSL